MTNNNHDRYVLVKVTDPCDAISAGAVRDILADQYRQVTMNKPTFAAADVTCFVGCEGLDFKSLTDLLLP